MSKNQKQDSSGWRNPNHVESAAAARIAANLTLGAGLRRRAASGLALGSFVIEYPVPATLNAFALAGFDLVVLDMEHSAVDFACLELLIAAAHAAGIATLVRPSGQDSGLIGKILDLGASGIMVPHVDSPERARAVVAESRYAPRGNRGLCPLSKYDSLGEPLRSLDDATYVVAQIEGIDAVFVGPYDLAMSLGVPPGSPQVFAAAERLAQAAPKGPTLGIYVDDPVRSADWAARGFALQVVGFDGRMLADAARAVAALARSGRDAAK
jgi:2-keto-3-deoxy-L-rhamnonate aldolase RhmA